jgi:hypothetical protein
VNEYFNYFTQIEEHFQRVRGTSLFLLSPLDWALLESWKSSGVPLEAVLRGIDIAFEKWRAKKSRTQMVNSIAYCTQAIMTEAQRMADQPASASSATAPVTEAPPPFPEQDLRKYLRANADAIRAAGIAEFIPTAESLEQILSSESPLTADLEALEQKLTVLEQRLLAAARTRQSEEQELDIRRQLDAQLRPWKSKMTASQIAMLESQYLERAILATAALPRLSLFYLQ